MRKDLLNFLYGPALVNEDLGENLVSLFEKADKAEADEMKADRKPLAKALKAIGVGAAISDDEAAEAECVFDTAEEYRKAMVVLSEPDNVHKLATMGWVVTPCGQTSMSGEEPSFKIGFLSLTDVDTDSSDKPESEEKIVKDARKFATTEEDRDDEMNPVENGLHGTKGKAPGVGKATDGASPEGKVKGAVKKAATSESVVEALLSEMTTASGVPSVDAPIGSSPTTTFKRRLKKKPLPEK